VDLYTGSALRYKTSNVQTADYFLRENAK